MARKKKRVLVGPRFLDAQIYSDQHDLLGNDIGARLPKPLAQTRAPSPPSIGGGRVAFEQSRRSRELYRRKAVAHGQLSFIAK